MLRTLSTLILSFIVFASCSKQPESGIDLNNFDKSIPAQEDFYRHVNGTWLKNTEIPADRSNYGTFTMLFDESEKNLRKIIEDAANAQNKQEGSEEQKVGDFFLSYMDSVLIEDLGLEPIKEELNRINSIKNKNDVLNQMAYFQKVGIQRPFSFYVNQDLKKSDEYIGYVNQSGLGLPDRDYYFKETEKFKDIREKYVAHIEEILGLADQENPSVKAKRIMEIETKMAKSHWTRVENRDRDKTYNKYETTQLHTLTPNFDWTRYFEETDISQVQELVVRQPSYLEAFNKIFNEVSVDDWKTYLTWKLLNDSAPLLSSEFVNANFEFYSKTLSGIEEIRPRWKRAVSAVNEALGEVVGKIYVERHFEPAAKERMVKLVDNLKLAFRDRVNKLDWMGDDTKSEALTKLSKFHRKIGYPDKWKDYSKLVIRKNELIQNMKRSNLVEYDRMISKLGKPIDREEWRMTPQTVNAYYNPPMNEIVFPAAILQPPFFNLAADDAVNYGAIGAVIGHEITHGFDDQGRKSDGDGNLRDWWTEKDAKEFNARAQVMVEQYGNYNPVGSMFVNGELTLGENIGDLGGLTIAYNAYKRSLGEKEAPVIDGYTGDQRFFIGWTQIWRRKYRDDELRRRLVTDPHSPSACRVIGVLSNMPEFYEAFDVKEGDEMYRPEDVRVKIW